MHHSKSQLCLSSLSWCLPTHIVNKDTAVFTAATVTPISCHCAVKLVTSHFKGPPECLPEQRDEGSGKG